MQRTGRSLATGAATVGASLGSKLVHLCTSDIDILHSCLLAGLAECAECEVGGHCDISVYSLT